MVTKSKKKNFNKENKLSDKQKERIIKNRESARRSYIKKNIKKNNLIIENQLIKESLGLIKIYFDNLNLIKDINELSRLIKLNIKLPQLYDDELTIIPSLYN